MQICNHRQRRRRDTLLATYRQLQLLELNFNEVFSTQTFNIFFPAFFNQTAVNYGTIRLYESLSFTAWAFCPYLSFSGAANLFMVQNVLASPYEASVATLAKICWKDADDVDDRVAKRVAKSCPPIRLRYASYKLFTKETAPEYLDSVIDSTVTLLLWK